MVESTQPGVVGQYNFLRVLGSGAQATVYLAKKVTDDDDQKLYAVKVFKKEADLLPEIKHTMHL